MKDEFVMGDAFRLLIVDDSKIIRHGLKKIFSADDRFQVVGRSNKWKRSFSYYFAVKTGCYYA